MKALLVAAMLALGTIGSVAGCALGCPTALAEGVLVANGRDLVLRAPAGELNSIIWPSGYSVRQEPDGLVLADFFGSIKAREGDTIGVGGGVGADNLFHGCGDIWVVEAQLRG